ncbi:hypothetical protein DACRYDRAFT_20618 [Dacryopinax primogenitus]|uniref:DUF6533 domain-containing protein n=1 Tax=Dacryopinax primogenitus (strain DJM 731) TaxID=1858805 RepID=M5G482_DACPD|nr:uncharacterized protein DACRYDRAFT_20618 [Dacryopinax primogenitus]EJU05071.1 hypothetical protein DACRYDRAFT_20618 [Dacryopinax primogenitus]
MDPQSAQAAQAELDAEVQTLFFARVNQYSIVTALCLVLYDIFLTTPDEVRLIWKTPRSITKYLYFFNRYATLIVFIPLVYVMCGLSPTLSDEVRCLVFQGFMVVFDNVQATGVVGALVLLRVYALYKNMRYIGYIIVALWLVYFIPPFVTTCHALATYFTVPGTLVWVPVVNMCGLSGKPDYLWMDWPFLILVESIVCTMITYKTWEHTQSGVRTPLLSALLRDGWIYYVAMLLGEIANLINFLVAPDALYFFAVFPFWALSTVLASRIYLNLRNVATPVEWEAATTLWNTGPSNRSTKPTPGPSRRAGSAGMTTSSFSGSDDLAIELGKIKD